jgi:hypothetical protein
MAHPIRHRAIPTPKVGYLDELSETPPPSEGDDGQESGKVGVVPAQITLSTRTLGYVGAVLLAVLGGGHVASLKFVAHEGTELEAPTTSALNGLSMKVTELTAQMAQIQQRQIDEQHRHMEEQRQHGDLLGAILDYQLEFGRFMRETAPKAKRPEELDRAERRLMDLARRR